MDGATLKHRIGGKALPLDEVIEWATEIADALVRGPQQGNHPPRHQAREYLCDRARPRQVLDFGLAKLMPAGRAANPSEMSTATPSDRLTQPGTAIGTWSYMSPEQVRCEEMDARTDLFSFGVVLYEMVTGVLPFRGESSGVVAEAILNRAPVAPVRLNPDVPPKLEEIISKALEKDASCATRAPPISAPTCSGCGGIQSQFARPPRHHTFCRSLPANPFDGAWSLSRQSF